MSYGMFPFCVQDDPKNRVLFFKRCTGTTDKDRVQRLNDAAQALQSCPDRASIRTTPVVDIAWYNNSQLFPEECLRLGLTFMVKTSVWDQGTENASPLHVQTKSMHGFGWI